MEPVPVWIIGNNAALRPVLCDVLSQAGFEILPSNSFSSVCRDLVRGVVGVVVADASDLFRLEASPAWVDEYRYLSGSVPVLLLTSDPETLAATRDAFGECEVQVESLEGSIRWSRRRMRWLAG